MTPNRRIFLNIVATYGRSLYALVCGLFTMRWALNALGHSDFGLYGLIGGLTTFILFFNGLLSSAVGRFYAFAVGKASVATEEGIEECRRWFSIAVMIHTVLPCVLVAIGYPIGVWAISDFLTVPAGRIDAAVWVWRLTCLSCFVGMVNVPFNAMYTAKQYIAELTIYSFTTTTLNVFFLYYIVTHSGVWLVSYAVWMCAMSVLPQVVICIRAICIFPECRYRMSYALDVPRIKSLFKFAGMNFFGALAQMSAYQGLNIIVNRYLGPTKNATMTVSAGINGHAASLSGALIGAFHPAITNAAGAGDFALMRALAFRACSLGALFVVIFAIPLMLEIDEVLKLWLGTPPDDAAKLCQLYLVACIIDKLTDGHWIAIFATGKIYGFRMAESVTFLAMPLLAFVLIYGGDGVACAGWALVFGRGLSAGVKLWFGRKIAGMPVLFWCKKIMLPMMVLIVVAYCVGLVPRIFMPVSLARLVLTTGLCEWVLLPLVWFYIFDNVQRAVVSSKFFAIIGR